MLRGKHNARPCTENPVTTSLVDERLVTDFTVSFVLVKLDKDEQSRSLHRHRHQHYSDANKLFGQRLWKLCGCFRCMIKCNFENSSNEKLLDKALL